MWALSTTKKQTPETEICALSRRELAYWYSRFGATVEELRAVVSRVGPIVERVEEELSKKS
jgi:hypothetical protein